MSPASKSLRRVALRRVVFDVDFRRSEETMWNALPRHFRAHMRSGDAVAFVNSTRDKLRVVFKPSDGARGLTSLLHRYDSGTSFSAYTLQDVAHAYLGVHFDGVKLFDEHFPGLRAAAEAVRRRS